MNYLKSLLKKVYKYLRLDLVISKNNRILLAVINDKITIDSVNKYGKIRKYNFKFR